MEVRGAVVRVAARAGVGREAVEMAAATAVVQEVARERAAMVAVAMAAARAAARAVEKVGAREVSWAVVVTAPGPMVRAAAEAKAVARGGAERVVEAKVAAMVAAMVAEEWVVAARVQAASVMAAAAAKVPVFPTAASCGHVLNLRMGGVQRPYLPLPNDPQTILRRPAHLRNEAWRCALALVTKAIEAGAMEVGARAAESRAKVAAARADGVVR